MACCSMMIYFCMIIPVQMSISCKNNCCSVFNRKCWNISRIALIYHHKITMSLDHPSMLFSASDSQTIMSSRQPLRNYVTSYYVPKVLRIYNLVTNHWDLCYDLLGIFTYSHYVPNLSLFIMYA